LSSILAFTASPGRQSWFSNRFLLLFSITETA